MSPCIHVCVYVFCLLEGMDLHVVALGPAEVEPDPET